MGKTVGERIREVRKRKGLKQRELAVLAETSESYISRIESGQTQDPGGDMLQRIARALGVSVSELLGEIPNALPAPMPSVCFIAGRRVNVGDPAYEVAAMIANAPPEKQALAQAIIKALLEGKVEATQEEEPKKKANSSN